MEFYLFGFIPREKYELWQHCSQAAGCAEIGMLLAEATFEELIQRKKKKSNIETEFAIQLFDIWEIFTEMWLWY